MTTINDFSQRLAMEFGLMPTAIHDRQSVLEREYHERQERLAKSYAPALAQLRAIWEPRRDALLAQFKDTIHIIPAAHEDFGTVTQSRRRAARGYEARFGEPRSASERCG